MLSKFILGVLVETLDRIGDIVTSVIAGMIVYILTKNSRK